MTVLTRQLGDDIARITTALEVCRAQTPGGARSPTVHTGQVVCRDSARTLLVSVAVGGYRYLWRVSGSTRRPITAQGVVNALDALGLKPEFPMR